MIKLFGDKNYFAIEYIGIDQGLVFANIFVSGVNITPVDNAHYDQYLVHQALGQTSVWFKEKVNWFDYELTLVGSSVEIIFNNLWDSEIWDEFEVFDWLPCTRLYRCAVIPYRNTIYLCCCEHSKSDDVRLSAIDPRKVADVMQAARTYIVNQSSSNFLKLNIT